MTSNPPTQQQPESEDSQWYKSWFGEEYLELYSHRDEQEATRQVAFASKFLPREGALLDIACGAGRHLRELRDAGRDAYGLDLSLPLLRRASRLPVVRGDMRALPFPGGVFQGVTNFFTSFGYFKHHNTHVSLLKEWRRVLAPGGVLLLDYLNAFSVLKSLVPYSESVLGGRRVITERRYVKETRQLVKTVTFLDDEAGAIKQQKCTHPSEKQQTGNHTASRTFTEEVTIYQPEEMLALLRDGGFSSLQWFGSFEGDPHTVDSPRVIVIAV